MSQPALYKTHAESPIKEKTNQAFMTTSNEFNLHRQLATIKFQEKVGNGQTLVEMQKEGQKTDYLRRPISGPLVPET